MHELTCRSCGANIHADDVNTAAGIAKCRHCGAVFMFGNAVGAGPVAGQANAPAQPRVREEIEKPSGFEIEEDAYRFRITQRWFSWAVIVLVVFAVGWNVGIWFGISTVAGDLSGSSPVGWLMLLFFVPFVLIGVAFAYGVVTMFVNSTTIDVNDRELAVRHGPLPVPGNKTLPSLDIQQLYCKQRVHHGKNGTSVTYALHVKLKGGRDEKVLSNLRQQSHALYVEQQVERVLGLKDEAVAGEMI
ncbi:MAG: hypothetical protein AAF823_15840 [Planctomycetota bacterium]